MISDLHIKAVDTAASKMNRRGLKTTQPSVSFGGVEDDDDDDDVDDVHFVRIDNWQKRASSLFEAFSTTQQPTMSATDTDVDFCFVDVQLQHSSCRMVRPASVRVTATCRGRPKIQG